MSYKLYDAEIEYLEGTGTQWINTGIKPNGNTEVSADITISSAYTYLFGARNGASDSCYMVSNNGGSNKAIFYYGTGSGTGIAANAISGRCKIDVKSNVLYVNGVSTVSRTAATFTTNYNLYLFAYNSAGSILGGNIASYKIHSFKIDNGEEKRDFIPVRVGNVGYLFDKISMKLFGNSGTGSFVLGSDVAPAAYANEVAFLESWGNQYIDTGIKPSTDTKIELKCLYCKSGAGLTNYGALIGADDRDTAYILNHSAVANFTYGLEFSNNFANPQTRLLTFDSTASPQSMRVYDEGGSLVTTLTCIRGVFEVNQNLYLFAVNRNGTPVYGSNRIMYCKIYDGDTLVRDYVPVEYNGIGYMYDKVSGLFFDNQGTGKFLFGSIAKACARSYTRRQLMVEGRKRLPHGFQEVEYIQNTSTSYINTGLKGKANLKIDATWLFKVSEVAGIMGASYNHKPNNALLYRANSNSTSYFYYGGSYGSTSALTLNRKWHIVIDKGKLYYDDVLKRTFTATGDSTYNFMLFRAADFATCIKGQLFGCKIYDDDVLVRDYVPCINLSTNKAGMYDLVTKTFYGSANSANFTAGKIVY